MQLTFDQLHVVLDALTQHADRIDAGTYNPTGIYEGAHGQNDIFPANHPLRKITEYRALTDQLIDTFNDTMSAAGETSTIVLTIEDCQHKGRVRVGPSP
jgi:hypothetical protein